MTAPSAHPTRVLLVEDSPVDAHHVLRILREAHGHSGPPSGDGHQPAARAEDRPAPSAEAVAADFDVAHVTTLQAALAALERGGVEVVVLDLTLPDADGLTSLDAVRSAAPEVPVVVVTGTRDEAVVEEVLARGAQMCLLKGSFDAGTLLGAVETAVACRRIAQVFDVRSAELRASEERFHRLVQSLPDAVLVLAQGGGLRFANRAAEAVLGVGPADLETATEALRREALSPGTGPVEVGLGRGGDGRERVGELWTTGITWAGEEAVMAVLRDITARKQLDEAQREAFTRLQEIDRLRSEFLNNVAHELGTPLTPVLIQLELLEHSPKDRLTDGQRKSLAMLERSLLRLSMVVEGLLTASRLQAGRYGVVMRDLPLAEVVEDAVAALRGEAERAKVALEVTPVGPEVVVRADRDAFGQGLHHVLGNAIRFTPAGGVVQLTGVVEGSEARIRVRDRCGGLSRQQAERMFRPFASAHDATREARVGVGLGLWVTRSLLALQGGRVACERIGPPGCTIAISMPLAATAGLPDPGRAGRGPNLAEDVKAAWGDGHTAGIAAGRAAAEEETKAPPKR